MKHSIFSSFSQSSRPSHEHRKDACTAGTSGGHSACDLSQGEDACTHSSCYLGVCLSQRCSRVHQKLAHGPVPLAGGLVQCGLAPKSKIKKPGKSWRQMKWWSRRRMRGLSCPVADTVCSLASFTVSSWGQGQQNTCMLGRWPGVSTDTLLLFNRRSI